MEKVTFVYQILPGEKVKIFSPKRQEVITVTMETFSKERNNPLTSKYVQWVEYKRSDVGSHFQTDSGLTMDLLNKDGVRILRVNDKP